jgi:hypothetical protein
MIDADQLSKTAKQGKHFCILPWIHFHAWPDKRVMPCCVADSTMPVSEITDKVTILDMMNSEEYKKMRKAMLKDEPYEACRRCYELEDLGNWTLRISQNKVRDEKGDILDIISATNEDGSIDDFKMKYMDIRFSNLCNFKCRSCGPGCSNLWGEEKLRIIGETEHISARTGRATLISNNEDGGFMQKLKPYLADVEECYFAGGEILIHPEHYECLDYWIENNLCHKVKLNYTTNMSKITFQDKAQIRDLFQLWNQFPNIELWASVDAIGSTGELIRKGFKWERIKKNLLELKERVPHVRVGITPTVSIWNIFNYGEMFDWMYDNGFISRKTPPRVNMLTAPPHAMISNLPDSVRLALMKRFREYYAKFPHPEDVELNNGFKMIMMALRTGKEDKSMIKLFFQENDIMDSVRNEQITDVIPELKEVREWAEKN